MNTLDRKDLPDHAFKGMFIHLLYKNGEIAKQGIIEDFDRRAKIAYVQTFSWADGTDYSLELVRTYKIFNDKYSHLYADAEAMNKAYVRLS